MTKPMKTCQTKGDETNAYRSGGLDQRKMTEALCHGLAQAPDVDLVGNAAGAATDAMATSDRSFRDGAINLCIR